MDPPQQIRNTIKQFARVRARPSATPSIRAICAVSSSRARKSSSAPFKSSPASWTISATSTGTDGSRSSSRRRGSTYPRWLADAHDALDRAVAAAYGWPEDILTEDALARLLALNLELAKAQ